MCSKLAALSFVHFGVVKAGYCLDAIAAEKVVRSLDKRRNDIILVAMSHYAKCSAMQCPGQLSQTVPIAAAAGKLLSSPPPPKFLRQLIFPSTTTNCFSSDLRSASVDGARHTWQVENEFFMNNSD